MKKKEYRFVPAYYEWHLIDEKGTKLLVMHDPAEDIMTYVDENNPSSLNMRTMTLPEMIDMCQDFIDCLNIFFHEEPERKDDGEGNTRAHLAKLPANAAQIMGNALWNYYGDLDY